jgi:hypothetical protein
MDMKNIVICVVALLFGILIANMLKDVCGCKNVVEGSQCTTWKRFQTEELCMKAGPSTGGCFWRDWGDSSVQSGISPSSDPKSPEGAGQYLLDGHCTSDHDQVNNPSPHCIDIESSASCTVAQGCLWDSTIHSGRGACVYASRRKCTDPLKNLPHLCCQNKENTYGFIPDPSYATKFSTTGGPGTDKNFKCTGKQCIWERPHSEVWIGGEVEITTDDGPQTGTDTGATYGHDGLCKSKPTPKPTS